MDLWGKTVKILWNLSDDICPLVTFPPTHTNTIIVISLPRTHTSGGSVRSAKIEKYAETVRKNAGGNAEIVRKLCGYFAKPLGIFDPKDFKGKKIPGSIVWFIKKKEREIDFILI